MRALLLLFAQGCLAGWNEGDSTRVCRPSEHTVDGQGYCADRSNGWFGGGAGLGNQRMNADSKCWRNFNYCNCPDCGDGDTQCKDWRCDDEIGVSDPDEGCLIQGARRESNQYDFCFRSFKSCDPCPLGWKRVGCMRASPGSCVQCFPDGVPPPGSYLVSGTTTCETRACTVVQPGQYQVSPCTATADTQYDHCSLYPGRDGIPGNPKSVVVGLMGQPYWYCPAGGVPQRLPVNSHPLPDYSAFECDNGFYQTDDGLCRLCPPGSACLHGRSYLCPAHYYSRGPGNAFCTRCTVDCPFGDQLPALCMQGSAQDQGCMDCNMCGFSLRYGSQCNENTDAMRRLPATCTPRASDTPVAVCQ